MNNKKKMTFLDYFILKIIVAGTFLLLYFKPAAFKIPGVETYPDARHGGWHGQWVHGLFAGRRLQWCSILSSRPHFLSPGAHKFPPK